MDDTFPDSGSRWIGALGNSKSRMPEVPAFVWASGGATRLTPARLPLIRPRRAMRD